MWRVLLVDDSALIRNAVHAALEPYGVELGHAENGQVALDLASASHWDLIFLDVVMPVMDGPTALRELRARGNTTPVVLVTSVSTATVVANAVKLGAVHYIAKPFTRDQVRAIAIRLLKLDPAATAPPRVLIQHADPTLAGAVHKLLPAHVVVDTSHALAQSLELAEAAAYDLVILESRELGDEMIAIANVLRRGLPAAAIFAITDDPAAPLGWHPDEGLDGLLPRTLDDATVRGFLAPSFLRPIVRLDRMIAQVAGFHGRPEHLEVYLAMLVRVLIDRCARLDSTADLQIDLVRMPADPEAVVSVIAAVSSGLDQAGPTPAFRLSPAMHAAAGGRLSRFVLL